LVLTQELSLSLSQWWQLARLIFTYLLLQRQKKQGGKNWLEGAIRFC